MQPAPTSGDASAKQTVRSKQAGPKEFVSLGDGVNMITIFGHLDQNGAQKAIELMGDIHQRIQANSTRKIIGFRLIVESANYEAAKRVAEEIKSYKKGGYSFYVMVSIANSAAVLIVALADKDKRFIYGGGSMTIPSAEITLRAFEISDTRTIPEERYAQFLEMSEYYEKNIWSGEPSDGFSITRHITSLQRMAYLSTGSIILSARECIDQFGFIETRSGVSVVEG